MHEESEDGKNDLPEPCLLLCRFRILRRQLLSLIALRRFLLSANQRMGRTEVRLMGLPPR
jgi:hypothetical protein